MHVWGKMLIAAAAPVLLTGCLWSPGKFNSELALRKGGAFVLDYRGEIILQLPNDKDKPATPWSKGMARCYNDGQTEIVDPKASETDMAAVEDAVEQKARPCTATEIAKLKSDYEKTAADQAAKKRKDADQMAKVFGLAGADDESNRRFAANLMKYKGWRSVAYLGKGVFDVNYHFEGRADQDFAFPMIPDTDLLLPFVAIRRRTDGAVLVTAPAFTGGTGPFGARAMAAGLPKSDDGPQSRAEGRFTVTTDGEILTNNSEDGPVAASSGKQLHWDVGPASKKIPETLVRL